LNTHPRYTPRDPRSEAGLTLVELLISMTMLGGIMAALTGIFTTTGPAANRDQDRALGIMDAQVGLAAMTRDLRQAQTINSATSSAIDFNATIDGVTQRVVYNCSVTQTGTTYKQCVKATSTNLAASPSLTGAKPVIQRLQSSLVFTYTPSAAAPTYIAVHIEVPRDGGYEYQGAGYQNNIIYDGGVYLPNRGTQ
jgi:type II secretory pathway pseudopilin PulG